MKKKIILSAAILLLLSGCGETPKLSNGDEAVVTFENGEMISANQLYEEIKDNYALQSLIDMVDQQILEKEYKDEVENAKTYAESTIKGLREQYEDEATLLQAIQYYTGFTTIEAYQDSVYLSYLRSEAITDYAEEQITDKEIKKYYESNVYGDVSINHILITPNIKDGASDQEKKDAETKAKEKVEKLIKELKDAKKDKKDISKLFSELAKKNSEDDATKEKGGSLGFVNYDKLSSDYKNILDAAYKLKDGEFSTEVITTTLGYHIIFRVEIKEKEKLDKVKDSIIETLAEELTNKDTTVSINALKELRKENGMKITDSEIQKQYALYIQNSLANAQNQEN